MSATNRGAVRRESDFYPTPAETTKSLINELDLKTAKYFVWGEPCCGDNAIINASGLEQWEAIDIKNGDDYLQCGLSDVDAIITNPPFALAKEFIEKSLGEAEFVAYLLRLNFLGSQKRHDWWQGKEPTHLFTLSKRPSFTGKGTDATEYAWFVWDRIGLCKREPGIYVI